MKTILLFVMSMYFFIGCAQAKSDPSYTNIVVYVFMAEQCPISQFYTEELRNLHTEFANSNLVFEGVFPKQYADEEGLTRFKTKYGVPFKLTLDHNQTIAKAYDANVMPEVIVVNKDNNKVLYKGRIDDSYHSIGTRKRVVTSSELKDVLTAISNHKSITTAFEPAVGCVITIYNN